MGRTLNGGQILMRGLIQMVFLGLLVWCGRNELLEPIAVNILRHDDRPFLTICMVQDLIWQLEWGPRVVTDVFEGPRTQLAQWHLLV